MKNKPSAFVQRNKSWLAKNIVSNYFKAFNLNADIYREYNSKTDIHFERLRQLSDTLYMVKEDLHLIYKRLVDPRRNKFELAEKYTPNEEEIRFINNVGILFHKAIVARELKYMIEYYETGADPDYDDIQSYLDDHIERLRTLFEKGLLLIKDFIANHSSEAIVLSYLIENSRYVEAVLGESVQELFKKLGHNGSFVKVYLRVADYCRASGWEDKAKKVLLEALTLEPDNKELLDTWAVYA